MEISIRNAKLSDILEYTELLLATYQYAYVDDSIGLTVDCLSREIFEHSDTQKYFASHLLDNENQKTWLAFVDNKMVGAITAINKNDLETEITGFYVAPEYQGKGIGKKLYQLAWDFSEKRDLVLDTYAHNKKSIAMYEKWGWEIDPTRGDQGHFSRHWPEWPEGLQVPCFYMRLKK